MPNTDMMRSWIYDVSLIFDNDYLLCKQIEAEVEAIRSKERDDPDPFFLTQELADFLQEEYEIIIMSSIRDDNSVGNVLIRQLCLGIPRFWFQTLASGYIEETASSD
jgi:hypothetical protein